MAAVKTVCNVTRKEFSDQATPLVMMFNGARVLIPVKMFSTGTMGWHLSKKVDAEIAGKEVSLQLNLQVFVVGSKEADPE